MKKLIPKIFLCTALASVMCISTAFAAGPISVSKTGSDVTVEVKGLSSNEETTLFVVQHGVSVADAFADTSKVYYLDQTPANSSGSATFGFTYDGTATLDIYSGYATMGINDAPLSTELKDESESGGDNTGEFMYGDVNNDGMIDTEDAVSVVFYFLSGTQFYEDPETKKVFEYGEIAANVNGDTIIDTEDAMLIIFKYLNGKEFPVNQK